MQENEKAARVVRRGKPSFGWMSEKYSENGTPC